MTLEEGATTLNGNGITWDWDWNGSTINQTNPTSSPSDVVTVEAQYESTLDGTFDQNFNVTVTDSYGCLSTPPTVVHHHRIGARKWLDWSVLSLFVRHAGSAGQGRRCVHLEC